MARLFRYRIQINISLIIKLKTNVNDYKKYGFAIVGG